LYTLSLHDALPILILLSRQPGDQGFVAPELPAVTRLELQPLGPDDARELLQAATAGSPLLPGQLDTLTARADGSPLFLLELLHALQGSAAVEHLPHSVDRKSTRLNS